MTAPGDDNPYTRLGVSPGASVSEIKKAYRRAAQKYHPDRNPEDSQAHDNFLRIQQAYQWLLAAPPGTPYKPASPEQPHEVPTYDPPTTTAPASSEPERMDGAATVVLWVRLDSLSDDREHTVSIQLAEPCLSCLGHTPQCPGCSGTGQVLRKRSWRIRVPARTPDGTWLLGRGMGHRGHRLRAPGDLKVQVKWKDPGAWGWEENRLVARIKISPRRLKKGGHKALRMPDGRWVWWTIPPNTQVGQEFNWSHMNWGGKAHDAWLIVERGYCLVDLASRRRLYE